ncbi:hypothetical protein PHISCL_06526 [Aspergillus sclerotialis]|uniref:MIT domain-containing protein n=1 Tax=Aspergillus sclerotialis TaxID=2070753 RepID=A0A3A2ZVV3_9EURO|nr:hypothetical protein PHISCL_06526 [Aspergillus sclerotialis]
MANYSISEDVANSCQRVGSRSSSLDSHENVRSQSALSLMESSAFAAPTSTMHSIGSEEANPSTKVLANTSFIKEGLGSLNRWSQSTTSSKSPPNNYVGHCRGISTISGYCDYGDLSAPNDLVNSANNNLDWQVSQTVDTNSIDPRSRSPHGSISSQTGLIMTNLSGNLPPNRPGEGNTYGMKTRQHKVVNDFPGCVLEPNQNSNETAPTIGDDMPPFIDDENSRERRHRGHSQKAMLSKALQKANTAVLLDNAANFEGAMDAYNEACQLLQLVMFRSNGGSGEKLRLQEIRDTYMVRINELQGLELSPSETEGKALPERPVSDESCDDLFQPFGDEGRRFSSTNVGPLQFEPHFNHTVFEETKPPALEQIPPRRQSLLPSPLDDELHCIHASSKTQRLPEHLLCDPHDSTGCDLNRVFSGGTRLPAASDSKANPPFRSQYSMPSSSSATLQDTNESTSWLDTIDESGPSSPSSQRSQASSLYLRRRKSSHGSHGTEAEFDAALDAAVEAAYDEGLEPAVESNKSANDDDIVANARRNVELAKQKVREAEREAAVAMTRGLEMRRIQEQATIKPTGLPDSDYLDEESEEEERLLEEMTRGYVMDDSEFDIQSKSALPRQPDSSCVSSKLGENLAISNPETAGALSTLVEDDVSPSTEAATVTMTPVYEESKPPPGPLTPADIPTPPKPTSSFSPRFPPSVRERRLSGQSPKALKIETSPPGRTDSETSGPSQSPDMFAVRPTPVPKDDPQLCSSKDADSVSELQNAVDQSKRNASISSVVKDSLAYASFSKVFTQDEDEYGSSNMAPGERAIGKVPSAPDNLGKRNLNLKAFRTRNVSVPIPDAAAESPSTPSSNSFPTLDFHKGTVTGVIPITPTPAGPTFTQDGLPSGGLYLFDSLIHSPSTPGSPNPMAPNAPMALEPCPESFLLRPFWLMRCIYQSIAHPCGGYLSTKLFVPRDIWGVKNVKLKAVDEKVSNCDLLTAALLKLAQVDTFDADAVLEEMQALEIVLDQVQASLSKKLGNDVGVQGSMPLFKPSPVSDDSPVVGDSLPPRISNGPSKSYLTSWRKLRSKNSGVGAATSLASSKETGKDNLTINSLPMTSTPSSQPIKRNVTQLQFNGPNANYMGALARLCDAAQVLGNHLHSPL